MRCLAALLLLVASSLAHDAVIFSSTVEIKKDVPSLESLVSSASAESPLVFLTNPTFVLGQFSKAAAVYSSKKTDSSIVNAAKAAKFADSRFVSTVVSVPSASLVSSAATLEKGQSIYVVSAENWADLDKLAAEVLAVLGDSATVVVTNTQVVSTDAARVKRDASSEETQTGETNAGGVVKRAVSAAADTPFPLIIPKVGDPRQICMMYMEGLNFVLKTGDNKYAQAQVRDDGTGTKKYGYDAPVCEDLLAIPGNEYQKIKTPQVATFTFTIDAGTFDTTPKKYVEELRDAGWITMSPISMELKLTTDRAGYWSLTSATVIDAFDITFADDKAGGKVTVPAGTVASQKSIDYMAMNSVWSWSWSCWDTQALFFKIDDKRELGISFHGIQLSVYGKDWNEKDKKSDSTMSYFGSKVDSCTGTFSAASWMGIITILVLIAIFVFGFLMLNNIQTLDRYDDPKQKQILINVRE